MTRQQIQDQLIAAMEADDVQAAEEWQAMLDYMDEFEVEEWQV
jgi:hypothetical protein